MSLSHHKVKSVAKVMTPRGKNLQNLVLNTLKTCSDLVGATLGPGGMSVVIERQESGLPPVVTKDGVTVFKSLGFQDPTQQVLMETAREASVRTAAEAGDGTTTATILSEAFVSGLVNLTQKDPHLSPQVITRNLQAIFSKYIEPELQAHVLPCDMDKNRERLYNVARISANGDAALADAVMKCYDLVGDEGNVTITEASGEADYLVEKIEGYPVAMGYEESCGIFFPEFINDPATQQCILKRPLWILYHGILNDFNEVFNIAVSVAQAASKGVCSPNIVVVATGFSDSFKAECAASFKTQGAVRVFPLLAPRNIQKTAQLDFLEDLAALTGARIFNPLNAPLDGFGELHDFGGREGPSAFECGRFRSSVIGFADEILVIERAEAIDKQIAGSASSELDRQLLRERKAKLTSGIARLIVRGASNGEVKEKRDRAEDAVCAVRAAIKYGALLGGGVTWLRVAESLMSSSLRVATPVEQKIIANIVWPALRAPVKKLYSNAGFTEEETREIMDKMAQRSNGTYDLTKGLWLSHGHYETQENGHVWVPGEDETLLDSYSAVRDALRNAISVASLLGTCGGAIVFGRDAELERREAVESMEYLKASSYNEADIRG